MLQKYKMEKIFDDFLIFYSNVTSEIRETNLFICVKDYFDKIELSFVIDLINK